MNSICLSTDAAWTAGWLQHFCFYLRFSASAVFDLQITAIHEKIYTLLQLYACPQLSHIVGLIHIFSPCTSFARIFNNTISVSKIYRFHPPPMSFPECSIHVIYSYFSACSQLLLPNLIAPAEPSSTVLLKVHPKCCYRGVWPWWIQIRFFKKYISKSEWCAIWVKNAGANIPVHLPTSAFVMIDITYFRGAGRWVTAVLYVDVIPQSQIALMAEWVYRAMQRVLTNQVASSWMLSCFLNAIGPVNSTRQMEKSPPHSCVVPCRYWIALESQMASLSPQQTQPLLLVQLNF